MGIRAGQSLFVLPPAPVPVVPVVPVVTAVVPVVELVLLVVVPGSLPADPPVFPEPSVVMAPPHAGASAPANVATVIRNGGLGVRLLLFARCVMAPASATDVPRAVQVEGA